MSDSKYIKIPNYDEQEFIVMEDCENIFDRPILTGVRFIIKNISKGNVIIKISNTKKELEKLGMLEYDFNRVINNIKSDIKILEKICKMWDDEPEKFIFDEDSYCNKNGGYHINTGYYQIPSNHPDKADKSSDDTIITFDYKRIDNKKNIYSYQRGWNKYYSKTCYEFMLKGEEVELEKWKNRDEKCKKLVLDWILEKKELTIKKLNKINFDFFSKK